MVHRDLEAPAARASVRLAFARRVTPLDNWQFRPDEFGGVAIDDERGLIYAGGRAQRLFAIDQQSGQVAWELQVRGEIGSVPVVDGDMLLVGTDDGTLLAIDLETREVAWRYDTEGTIRNSPLVADDVVYFTNSRQQVFAVDRRDGTWRWQYEREIPRDFTIYGRAGLSYVPASDPESDESGLLLSGFDDGRVVAIGASSGEPLWVANLAPTGEGEFADVDSTPLLDTGRGMVVVGAEARGVIALALENGEVLWESPIEGAGSPVAAPGGLAVVSSSRTGLAGVELGSLDGSYEGGRIRWQTKLDPGVVSDPVVIGETGFVTHSELGLVVFDARFGDVLGRLDTGNGMSSKPVLDVEGGRLYATSNRGQLFAFDLDDQVVAPSR